MRIARPSLLAVLAGLTLAAAIAPQVQAQQVYRIVGPDGRVTFSDKPPADPNAKATTAATGPGGSGGGGGALPFELRQTANRYPVTLYTSASCGPCGSGRSFLSGRGIPFSEKTVSSNADIEALQRISGASSVPFLTIGSQQIRGFSESEWTAFLDAAGYPKTSQLPANFRQAAATPLVAVQAPAAAAPAAPAAPSAAAAPSIPAPPPPSGASNPAGITF